jgi:lambda family phage portal protein
MNLIDNVYMQLNPEKALKREVARQRVNMLRSLSSPDVRNSGYDEGGASRRKNSMKGWNARSSSPQKDIDLNLNLLRQRSRSLFMTAPIATSAIKTNRTNVIGSGLVLKSRIDYEVLGITHEAADQLEKKIEKEWALWSESKFCDNNQQHNFLELQQIAIISWFMNGDCFGLMKYKDKTKYMPYQLRVKLIEGDKVSTPDSYGDNIDLSFKSKNGNRIINGIEIDPEGAVVAYYIANAYSDDYETEKKWQRVIAYGELTGNPNIVHIFEAERCEQYRGVPYLAPVIESLKQLTRYTEAEIMAAVINGLFSVFIKTQDGEEVDFNGVDEDGGKADGENAPSYELGNGLINYLQPGESIEIADAKRPNVNFDGFVSSMTKYIGAALEIPVELLTKNFTASYSASRAALLEAWKAFRMRRTWFANDFCQPIFELWLSEAVSKGRINAPGFFNDPIIKKAYCRAEWNGPAQGQLNPTVEVEAAKLKVENGFSTREKETIEMNGGNFDSNVEQLLLENQKMNKINMNGEGGK